MKQLIASLVMAAGVVAAFAGTGKLDYFEPAALERADMTGVRDEINGALARCDAEFAAAERLALALSGRDRDALRLRIEIGRRLEHYIIERHADGAKDLELMAWQGAKELKLLFGYFAAERNREKARLARTEPVVLNLADFGAKGDGATDCGNAFRAAVEKAKSFGGRPVTIRIGSGVFAVAYRPDLYPKEISFPSYRDYGEKGVCPARSTPRQFERFGKTYHLPFHGLANVTIEGGFDTEVRFLDSTRGGFGFFGCTETALRNVKISYRDNPSTQGTVVSLLEGETGFVFRRDSGYPNPDEPRFTEARSCRFTVHSGADQQVGLGGTGRMGTVRRVSDDTFEFRPFDHFKKDKCWLSVKPGDRMIVIARYSEDSGGIAVNFVLSSFSGADGVTIYDAPGQNILLSSSYAMHLHDCRVTVRHGSSDLVSSNADGMMGYGEIGPYVDGCVFEHMEDDGFNIGTGGTAIERISEDRLTVYPNGCGAKAAFQVDAVTGRIKDVVRRGKSWQTVERPMCPETLTKADLDGGAVRDADRREWNRKNGWVGTRGEKLPDKFNSIPGTVGSVIRNTRLHDLRGMGVQVHSANMIIENVEVDHVSGPGANVNALFGWGMLFNTHNVLVRNCTFRDVSTGVVVRPGSVQPGIVPTQKMFLGIDIENNVCETRNGNPYVSGSNCQALRIDGTKFTLTVQRAPDDKRPMTVSSDYADRVSAYSEGANGERIEYVYTAQDAPVRKATVYVKRDPADGARRYRLKVHLAKGWFISRARFPEYALPLVRGGDPSDDRLMVGSTKGGYHEGLESSWNGVCLAIVPRTSIAQFAAIWDDDSGVYFGMEDAEGYPKTYGFRRENKAITFYNDAALWKDGTYEMTYPVVVREVKRSGEPLVWQDFADIYREWGSRQKWMKTKYRDRRDIPSWMKDAPALTRFSRQWMERPEDMKRFVAWWKRTFGEMPVVAALWGWEKYGTWWGPDYFPCHPSDEVFVAEMKDLAANDFHAFAWPSGYNWCKYIGDKGDGTYEIDLRKDWIAPNESHLVVGPDGKKFHQDAFWLRFGALTTLCGGDKWSIDWWCNLTKEIGRRGVDIVQVDQVVGGKILDCWSTEHGHPQGPGVWQWKAFRSMFESMRADLRSVRPEGVVGVEEPCEMFIDIAGIQDYRDLETNKEKIADVYGYLYQDYMPRFQSNPFVDEFFSLAHMAASGQMPFVRPNFAELDETRPALANGGFENLVASVRGPYGWDRLIPGRLMERTKRNEPLWNFTGHNNMGWFGYSVTLDYGVKHGGEVSLKFDPPAKGGRDNGEAMQVSQTVENLEPGVYTVSAWVKCDDVNAPAAKLLYGTHQGEIGRIEFPTDTTEWTLVKAEVKVVDQLRLIVFGPAGSRFHIDDVRLERNGEEVRVSGDSPYVAFMKDWIRLYRGEGRSFIAEGRQIKPPRIVCDNFRFAARCEQAVRVGAYRNAKGEEALVFANASNRREEFTYRWNGKTFRRTIAPHGIELVK